MVFWQSSTFSHEKRAYQRKPFNNWFTYRKGNTFYNDWMVSITDQVTPTPWSVTDTIHQEACSSLLCTWYCNQYWPSSLISNTVGIKWPNFTWYNESSLTLFHVKVKVKIKIQRHTSVISKSSVFHSRFKICFFLLSHGIHVGSPQSWHWLQSFPKALPFSLPYT